MSIYNHINIKSEQLSIETGVQNSLQNPQDDSKSNLDKYANQQIEWRQRAKAELIVCLNQLIIIYYNNLSYQIIHDKV